MTYSREDVLNEPALMAYREIFLHNPHLIHLGVDDSIGAFMYYYDDGSLELFLIDDDQIRTLLEELNIKYEIKEDNIAIKNFNEKEYTAIMLIIGISYNLSDYLYVGENLDEALIWMIEYNFLLALRYVEKYIDSFYIFVRLLHDFAYNDPPYYQRVLLLGGEYLLHIHVFKKQAFDIKYRIIDNKRLFLGIRKDIKWGFNKESYQYPEFYEYLDWPEDVIDTYLKINDLDELKIKIKDVNDEMIWISYNEMKAKINYYLASILIGKPDGVQTPEERRELFKYLLLAGNEDESRRLRNQFIKAYLGKSMSDPFEINFDIETMINLIDQLRKN